LMIMAVDSYCAGHKDFMPLTWRPRMDETWGCAAR
jgi:hypothetical protein